MNCSFWSGIEQMFQHAILVSYPGSVIESPKLIFAGFGQVFPVMVVEAEAGSFLVVSPSPNDKWKTKPRLDTHFSHIILIRPVHEWEGFDRYNLVAELLMQQSKERGITYLISGGYKSFSCINR